MIERATNKNSAVLDAPVGRHEPRLSPGDVTRQEFDIVEYVVEQLLQRIERLESELKALRADQRRDQHKSVGLADLVERARSPR